MMCLMVCKAVYLAVYPRTSRWSLVVDGTLSLVDQSLLVRERWGFANDQRLATNESLLVLRLSLQQIERMRQQIDHRRQRVHSSRRAARKIQNQTGSSRPADRAT
jgi:hypothetical protein